MATSASSTSGNGNIVITLQRTCADQLCVPQSGGDVAVISMSRTCAKQLQVALTLALGGKPNQKVIPNQGKKGKGKGKGKASGSAKTQVSFTPPKSSSRTSKTKSAKSFSKKK